MPKRSNLQQAVIYYVKRHLAPADVEVTESKMLLDADSGKEHEVDVVIEGEVAAEPIVVSVEVTATQRRAGTPWVNQMIQKHTRMPTGKLVLVSWSGFSDPALSKIENQGGRVIGLTPEPVPGASVPDLHYLELATTPADGSLLVRDDEGALTKVTEVPIGVNLYASPSHDSYVFMLSDLVMRYLNEQGGMQHLLQQASEHDDRRPLDRFLLEMSDLDHHGLFVHDGQSFRQLSAFRVEGPSSVSEQPVQFEVMRLGETLFAMTELMMVGKSSVWVLTPNDDGSATVSWQLV